MQDELRAEYDLTSLRVRKLGPGRNRFGGFVDHLRSVRSLDRDKNAGESCE